MVVFICRHKAKLERQSPLKNKQKDTGVLCVFFLSLYSQQPSNTTVLQHPL